jgi:glutathione reductase (NADPH)
MFGNIDRPAPSYENIPTAVFSRPNIGTVGMTEAQAHDEGHDITVYKSDF